MDNKFLNFLREDFQRKIVAIFFAILIWLFVDQHINEVETFADVKVELINPNNSPLVVGNQSRLKVTLSLRGSQKILKSLDATSIKIVAPLPEGNGPGLRKLKILPEYINIPSSLKIESILTRVLNVEVDEMAEKEVPVRLLFQSALSRNYRLRGKPEIEPKTKIVRGPSRRLDNLNYLTTKPFLIDGSHTKDYISSVALNLPEGVTVEYDKVKTVINIEAAEKSMVLTRQSLSVMSAESLEVIELPYVDAIIYGPPGILEDMDVKELHFFVKKTDEDQLQVEFWSKHPEINVQSIMPNFIVNPWKKK